MLLVLLMSLSVAGTASAAKFVAGTGLSPTNGLQDISGQYLHETGYGSYSFSVGASGTYTIGFGVVHSDLTNTYSGLLVDDVVVAPLPSVAYGGMVLIGGLGLMQGARRRKTVNV